MGRPSAGYEHPDGPPPDVRLAMVAAERHNVVTTDDLSSCGIRGSAVQRRVMNGRLHRKYKGVFALGSPRLNQEGVWLAAVLASGPDAVLSHVDAAVLWGIHARPGVMVHVTTAQRSREGVEGIRLHRVRRLSPQAVTMKDGIPVTTVARTLVDLTDMFGRERLTRIIREAQFQGVLNLPMLDQAIATANGRKRIASLIAAVEAHRPGAIVHSELEHAFLELCRNEHIPDPETNVPMAVGGRSRKLDCLWREQHVVVELDGRSAHNDPRAFEDDRARDTALNAAGYRTLRYTWQRVTSDAARVAAELRAVLSTQSSTPSSRSTLRAMAKDEA